MFHNKSVWPVLATCSHQNENAFLVCDSLIFEGIFHHGLAQRRFSGHPLCAYVTSFLENAAFYKMLSIFLGNTKSQAMFYKKNLPLQNVVSFNKTCLIFAYLLLGKWHVLLNALVSVTHYLLICRSIVLFCKMTLYS